MKNAIVIGAGTAGMLISKTLSLHYDKVYLIERDHIRDDSTERKGIPQQHHIHTLLAKGLQILDTHYPNIQAEMDKLNCPEIRWGEDIHAQTISGVGLKADIGIKTRGISRSSLDKIMRMFTLQTENIILVADARVTGLLWKQNSVIGIQFEQGQNKENHTLEAELTVIASGRTTPISEWLRQANLSIPQATSLNSYLGYASRRYKVPNDVRLDSKVIAIQPRPKKQFYRGAGATQVENNEVIITLVGVNADYPPTEETKYLDFARSLTDPKTSEWIESLTPIGPIVGYRPISTLQHFDQIPNFPDGLLIMGDALCSFNPFYGQGMSVAATSSIMLDKILSQTNTKNLKGFTQRFQKSLAQSLFFPWYVGAAEDLRYPQTEGINPDVLYKLAQYGTDFLLSASGRDVIIGKKFLRVMHMLDNPIQLLTPIYGLHCLRYTTTSLFKSLRNIISAAPTST